GGRRQIGSRFSADQRECVGPFAGSPSGRDTGEQHGESSRLLLHAISKPVVRERAVGTPVRYESGAFTESSDSGLNRAEGWTVVRDTAPAGERLRRSSNTARR